MSDESKDVWAEYDALKAAGNPHAAAQYYLAHRLEYAVRPAAPPAPAPEAPPAESAEMAQYRALKAQNPIVAAKWALKHNLFGKY